VPVEDCLLVTFWHLMHYLYTDALPVDFNVSLHALALLEQAQKYDLSR